MNNKENKPKKVCIFLYAAILSNKDLSCSKLKKLIDEPEKYAPKCLGNLCEKWKEVVNGESYCGLRTKSKAK